ncbi:MAG: hypothetical protein PVI36_11965, partial [Desulfobacterales bacterium]
MKHQDKTKEKITNEKEQQRRKHAEVEMVTAGNNGLHRTLWQEGHNSRYRINYLAFRARCTACCAIYMSVSPAALFEK